MSIELRHLRYFIAVADELHFGRAAERLGMSQPPLSQQIRQLEQRLGVRLLVRSNRRVALTGAGRAFLEEARAILARLDHAVDLAQRAARGETGELRIGFTRSTPLSGHIPRAILAFRREAPAVQLELEELNSLQQIDALLERRLDVGILRGRALPEPLASRRLFRDPLVAVLREGHPALRELGARRRLRTGALAQEPFVLFARTAGAGIHDHVIALCRHAGFAPRVAQEAREASTIVGLVAAGLGVSILPASCERIRVPGVRFVPLADPASMSEIHVVHRRDERSPLVARFVRLLLAAARDEGAG
ncbi:LysR substrate-binding domain-containing protein [Fulvimonas soli]|uniref:LysR family transcriptional regulator n=1 Tax=Fulvimonas soli TaxID=155197 RepID=A0A316HYP9_9GAMM|nr:LysR substrate-binding domain-containing protein [Fulvimonas soli]PWK85290.1 LysR family transcriptional regulator [Fulvimonas soli]TNY26285.1 LysR family transcriptional regulator [Fulvimonas soli]